MKSFTLGNCLAHACKVASRKNMKKVDALSGQSVLKEQAREEQPA
jgi:hypothetical protein